MSPEVRKLIRSLKRQDWQCKHRGSGHILLTSPEGKTLTIAATPSDRRAIRNIKADIRRTKKV